MSNPPPNANSLALLLVALALAHASAVEKVALAEPEATASSWQASLSTGWDSLYMFRGVNQLPGFRGYGSGISWTSLSLTANITPQDFLAFSTWSAFGIDESGYKEVDGNLTYTHTIGDLSLTAGYSLYAVLDSFGGLFSNELTAAAVYECQIGVVKITPGITYAYTLGPGPGQGGYIPSDVGYLELRVDGQVPVFKEIVTLSPWVAEGFSFGYNQQDGAADQTRSLTGADHMECGVAVPIALGKSMTVSPYIAYSHSWVELAGTRTDTAWCGVSLELSF